MPETGDAYLRLECEYWTIVYEGQVLRMRDTVGIRQLAQLLWNPDREFPCLDLVKQPSKAGRRRRAESVGSVGAKSDSDAAKAERARVAVAKTLKAALDRIRPAHPELADYLDATLKRGYVCVYRPDPRNPIRWGR